MTQEPGMMGERERGAVTRQEAIAFLECACRNWGKVQFDKDGLEDVRVELQRLVTSRLAHSDETAGLVDRLT